MRQVHHTRQRGGTFAKEVACHANVINGDARLRGIGSRPAASCCGRRARSNVVQVGKLADG
jgi:hypothetical protein